VTRPRYPWWMGPASALGAAALWLLGRSWRIDLRNAPGTAAAEQAGEPLLYAVWHAWQLPLVFTHRGRGVVVLVSRHRDGELITRILERFGFGTARGSSTRGGEAAVLGLRAAAQAGRCIAITPDGPRGPAERAKDGVAFLAAQLGVRVVPVASAARDAWVLRSWDRFRIPRPFARVCVEFGEPLAVARDGGTGGLEGPRARIEAALGALTAEVAARAGETA
jgi:lysophospholipid acyltransferase (LPLAT)-like uncharacterized protein